MQVVAANAALQHPTRNTSPEVAAKEIEAFPAFPEVNDLRLLRMQLKPQTSQDRPGKLLGSAGLRLAAANHDKIVRIANEGAVRAVSERPVERLQVDVREQRRNDCSHASANFEFERLFPRPVRRSQP